jgi:hypothetical protein
MLVSICHRLVQNTQHAAPGLHRRLVLPLGLLGNCCRGSGGSGGGGGGRGGGAGLPAAVDLRAGIELALPEVAYLEGPGPSSLCTLRVSHEVVVVCGGL